MRRRNPRYVVVCQRTGNAAFHGKTFRTRSRAIKFACKRIPYWAWQLSAYVVLEVPR